MIQPSGTIAVIPARGGSKGLRNKNLQTLQGIPLIGRAIQAAAASEVCDTILVATDSEQIAEVARRFGAEVPFLRTAEDASDLTTTEQTLTNALRQFEHLSQHYFEFCVYLSPSESQHSPESLRFGLDVLRSSPEVDSVFAALPTHKNFWVRTDDDHFERTQPWMSSYSSRQIRKRTFREDTGIGCVSRAWIWREGRRIGDRVQIFELPDTFLSWDIHSALDLRIADFLLTLESTDVRE